MRPVLTIDIFGIFCYCGRTMCQRNVYVRIWAIGVILAVLGSISLFSLSVKGGSSAFSHLKGYFLIQPEQHGEAWYVTPDSGSRLYVGSPAQAFVRLRTEAEPVSYETLARIPVGSTARKQSVIQTLNKRGMAYAGRILVQADRAPHDAWYVSPTDGLRYSLRSPAAVLSMLRHCALGIADDDIADIPSAIYFEDAHPLSRKSLSVRTATIAPKTAVTDIPQETIDLIERILEENARDTTQAHQVAVMSVRGTPVLMYPQYRQWYLFGSDINGRNFHIENVAAAGGRYISYEKTLPVQLADGVDAFLYGLYIFDEQRNEGDDQGVSFLVRDSNGLAVITLKILLTEQRVTDTVGDIQESYRGENMLDGYAFLYDDTAAYILRYDSLWKLEGVDMATLRTWKTRDNELVVGDQYGLFGVDAFGQPYRMIDENPEQLSLASALYDPLSGKSRKIKEWNDNGYRYIADGRILAKDDRVYVGAVGYDMPFLVEGADAASFTMWPDGEGLFFTDLRKIYYRGDTAFNALPGISAATFTLAGSTADNFYFKDESGIYQMPRRGVFNSVSGASQITRISHVDSESFRVLYSDGTVFIAKDRRAVYVGPALSRVSDADAASFHIVFTVEGIPFGRDQYNIFYALPKNPHTLYRLKGADPRTFQLKTVPTVEPALEGLTYPGSDMLVYAHDDMWIWLYDNAHDGLTLVKRADSNENVTQDDMLNFARMYASLFP